MGIRGLTEFICNNNLTIPHNLHDTKVVIDGSNLIFNLYIMYKVDSKFGGDYSKFADGIKKYFDLYQKCNIEPLVIFDGGLDKSDNLLTTGISMKYKRMHEKHINKIKYRLQDINTLIQGNFNNEDSCIFPINAYEVCKDVLSDMKIQCVQCDYEGDNQMAAMANKLKCPLISDDSDFYLFDLKYGFIKFSEIEHSIERRKKKNKKYKYLKCRLYSVKSLAEKFKLNINILPLFSALCGNRYVYLIDFKEFYTETVLKECKTLKNKSFDSIFDNYNVHIHAIFPYLLKWLSTLDLERAKAFVVRKTCKKYQWKAKYLMDSMVEDYRLDSEYVTQILSTGLQEANNDVVTYTKLVAPCGSRLPVQFISDFHKGILPSFFFNIISLRRKFLSPQIEEFSSQSSYKCSLYIRQVMYSILSQHETQNDRDHNENCLIDVVEYDRPCFMRLPEKDDQLQEVNVEHITNLRTGESIPDLKTIYDMNIENRNSFRIFIAKVIGVEESFFTGIPSHLQLLFGCIEFWLLNCSPKPKEEVLSALILCIMYHQLQDLIEKCNVFPDPDCENNDSKSIHKLIQNVPIESAQKLTSKFQRYYKQPHLSESNPFDICTVHSYSQFQTCFLDINCLNLLMNLPFEGSKLHKTTDGTMLYNITQILKVEEEYERIKDILNQEASLIELYNSLKGKFFENRPNDYFN